MLDKLLDFLKGVWNDLIPVEVVPPMQLAVIQLRMGKALHACSKVRKLVLEDPVRRLTSFMRL